MFTQIVDPVGNLGLTCLVALIPVVLLLLLLAVFRVSAWLAVLIGSIVTFVLAAWVWQMPLGTGLQAYIYGAGDRRLERGLDHLLGPHAVQHAEHHGRVRELPPLAHLPGHARHPRADDAVRLGVRRAARGPGRLRLSLGGGGADPDYARADRPRRHPRRRHRQQRAGVLRRAGRADHRAGRGDRAIRCWRCRARSAPSSPCWRCCRPGC